MRLLKREASGWFGTSSKFTFVECDAKSVPHYAILSHRWGPDEVTFGDIKSGTNKAKTGGYKKLEFCANQAAQDGLLYFWVDTCCINKDSCAELSTAINSMFKWYRNATKCYVYLSDVREGPEQQLTFQKSEWFNRGWTLQELIAPTVVEFFAVEGVKLGDKKSLEQQICQVTGISIDVLRGKPLSQIDEKERFSWTTQRKTTIEEDLVYCVLGIFDVQMPLVYGEGQQKALARLRREIRSVNNPDLDVNPAQDVPWIVPFERNPLFTGRETQLAELEGKLFATHYSTSKLAIAGLGGVGKTQLVLELLYRTRIKHPTCSVMWIAATTIESLEQGYLRVAQQLEIPDCNNPKADIKQLVQQHLSKDEIGKWLLVFDNADDIDMWTIPQPTMKGGDGNVTNQMSSVNVSRLLDYLPRNRHGCIVFTTRNIKAAVKFAQQNTVTVSEMSEGVAVELLKKSLIRADLLNNYEDVSMLLTTLTHLPLAITQAVAYINANGITIADYISLLQKEEDIIETLSEDFEDYGRYSEVKNPVATTWLISFEQIRRSDSLAAEYLSFIACISPKNIPQSLLPPGSSRKKELDAIGTLSAYSLITWRSFDSAIDVHRLVHLTTRNWLRKEERLNQQTEKTIKYLQKAFPNDNHQNRSMWRLYLPHTLYALASSLVSDEQKQLLMWKCTACLHSDGRFEEAEPLVKRVLAVKRKISGEEAPVTLAVMVRLAITYWELGRPAEAEQLEVQIMQINQKNLGPNHPDTLTSMQNLAATYWLQKRLDEAEKLAVQAMQVRKTTMGPDHKDTLNGMSNLASIYKSQNRLDEAEQLEVQVMQEFRATLGADHPITLISMSSLARTWKRKGRSEEAIGLMQDCFERRTRALGAQHPRTLSSLQTLSKWQAER